MTPALERVRILSRRCRFHAEVVQRFKQRNSDTLQGGGGVVGGASPQEATIHSCKPREQESESWDGRACWRRLVGESGEGSRVMQSGQSVQDTPRARMWTKVGAAGTD